MKRLLRNRWFVGVISVILTFAAGLAIGSFWIAPPNGLAVDAKTLQPGRYTIVYPYAGPIAPLSAAGYEGETVLLVLYDVNYVWNGGDRLVAVNTNEAEWKELSDQRLISTLEVSLAENGKKKFVISWQPKAH